MDLSSFLICESRGRFRGGGSENHGKDASLLGFALKPKIPPRPFFPNHPLFVQIIR